MDDYNIFEDCDNAKTKLPATVRQTLWLNC